MAKDKKIGTFVIIALLVGAIGAYLYLSGKDKGPAVAPGIENDDGICVPESGREGISLTMCCYDKDADGNWINIPCVPISDTEMQALYTVSGTTYRLEGVRHVFDITNEGNVDAESMTLSTAISPSNTELTRAYGYITGSTNELPIASGASQAWQTDIIDLSKVTGTTTITLTGTGRSGTLTATESTSFTFEVVQEALGFSINVNLLGS